MFARLSQRLDEFGRGHPRVMTAVLVVMAAAATVVMLASGGKTAVLYQAF